MKKENCVFCDYDKSKLVRENNNVITLFSNPYLLKGHCLVIPKKHYENIWEIPDLILFDLVREVRDIGELLISKFRTSGIDIRQNYRPFLNESKYKVNHLHFHVIPREFGDELYRKSMIYEKEVFKELDETDLNELIARLK